MKWNEEEDKKKPLISLLCKSIRPYLSHSLSLSASSAPTLLYLYAHTHTQNTLWQKVCPSVEKERVVLFYGLGFHLQIRVKKMQKKCVCSSSSFIGFGLIRFLIKKRKKRSPLSSFFLRFWSSKKKSFRRWDARKEALKEASRLVFLTFYTITSSSTMAASSLTAAALGSKVAFANKVRLMNNASFRLWLFFLFLVSFRARARCTRKDTHERDNFLCKILSSLPWKALVPNKREEKGLQNAFFSYEECASRDVNDDLFVREWKTWSRSRVWFSDRRFYVRLRRKRARWMDDDEKSTSYTFSGKIR